VLLPLQYFILNPPDYVNLTKYFLFQPQPPLLQQPQPQVSSKHLKQWKSVDAVSLGCTAINAAYNLKTEFDGQLDLSCVIAKTI
jgi:hypothetical protein